MHSNNEALNIILSSTFFDADWYETTYKDVSISGLGPGEHFLQYGGGLMRDPSPFFCTKTYMANYPDVKNSGLNPLYHYLVYGISEGRDIAPSQINQEKVNPSSKKKSLVPSFLPSDSSISSFRGEIESISNGDVLYSLSFRFKGWIDTSYKDFSKLKVVLQNKNIYVTPDIIRADVKGGAVRGFDILISGLENEVNFELKVYVETLTGSFLWKSIFIWVDNFSENLNSSNLINGEALIYEDEAGTHLKGFIKKSEILPDYISVYQNGENILNVVPKETSESNLYFDSNLKLFNENFSTNLYFASSGYLFHWLSIKAKKNSFGDGLHVISPRVGEVINSERLVVTGESFGGKVSVLINGMQRKVVDVVDNKFLAEMFLTHYANSLMIEVFDDSESCRNISCWRHYQYSEIDRNFILLPVHDRSVIGCRETKKPYKNILVIRRNPFPTDEIYILSPLAELEAEGLINLNVINTDGNEALDSHEVLADVDCIIVSRYLSDYWIEEITKYKDKVGSVVYIMDDDVLAAKESYALPDNYRKRMVVTAYGEFQSLFNICDIFVVTSDYLYDRYKSSKTVLMHPQCLFIPDSNISNEDNKRTVIAYHGTDSHKDDLGFIAPALLEIHNNFKNVEIEILMAKKNISQTLLDLSRLRQINPLSWNDFKEYREKNPVDIFLAPLLATPYNKAKSIIKYMDSVSAGAVGIYSNRSPYAEYVVHNKTGILVNNDKSSWVRAVSFLLENKQEISRISMNARKDVVRYKLFLVDKWKKLLGFI